MNTIDLEDFIKIDNDYKDKKISLCIGVFDGIHLGHQEILNKVTKNDFFSVVITFNRNPKMQSGRRVDEKPLLTKELQSMTFEKMGFDLEVIIDFSRKISKLSADEFLQILCKNLDIYELVVGEDFQLGNPKKSLRSFELQENINRYSSKTKVVITKAIIDSDNKVISSTRIRQLIKLGKMDVVQILLGREYLLDLGSTPSQVFGNSLLIKTENIKQLIPNKGSFIGFWVEEKLKATVEIEAEVIKISPFPKSSDKFNILALS
ncbi:MAG: hypothetical protein ACPKM0_12205 [Pleomorphochaeta sp.]